MVLSSRSSHIVRALLLVMMGSSVVGCGLLLDPDPPSANADGSVGDGSVGVCVEGEDCDTGNPCELGRTVCRELGRTCVPSGPAPIGTVCRPSRDACDRAETCEEGSTVCPSDQLHGSDVVCRDAVSECDVADRCDGANEACPFDERAPLGNTCSMGFCDNSGACSDTCVPGDSCSPSNPCEEGRVECSSGIPSCEGTGVPLTLGTPCRPAVGRCDIEDTCDGVGTSCPSDERVPEGVPCLPSTNVCDAEEQCDGTSSDCPVDAHEPDGTPCSPCGTWECTAGTCLPTTPGPVRGLCSLGEYCCPMGCDTLICF